MKFTFNENKPHIRKKFTSVNPGDLCELVNIEGEHAVFIVVDVPDVMNKCALCDLRNKNYMPHKCAYYDFQCKGRMAFKSLDKVLEDL